MIPAGGPEPRLVLGRCETVVTRTSRGGEVRFREVFGHRSHTWVFTIERGRVTALRDFGDPAPQYMR
jgi:hypothetical protein